MIKKIFIIFALLIFAGAVLGGSIAKGITKSQGFKITPITEGEVAGQIATPSPTVTPAPVDYYLVYPGILPDHFLYPLKMIRDRILLYLTFDSVKRAERLLLFADKRLGAAKALIEGGKVDLGVSTMTKAEKYLEQAINQAEKATKAGKDTTVLYEQLAKATLKHEEILQSVYLRVPDQAKPVIEDALRYSRQGFETVTRVMEQRREGKQE